jgi:hypothetical protein
MDLQKCRACRAKRTLIFHKSRKGSELQNQPARHPPLALSREAGSDWVPGLRPSAILPARWCIWLHSGRG